MLPTDEDRLAYTHRCKQNNTKQVFGYTNQKLLGRRPMSYCPAVRQQRVHLEGLPSTYYNLMQILDFFGMNLSIYFSDDFYFLHWYTNVLLKTSTVAVTSSRACWTLLLCCLIRICTFSLFLEWRTWFSVFLFTQQTDHLLKCEFFWNPCSMMTFFSLKTTCL